LDLAEEIPALSKKRKERMTAFEELGVLPELAGPSPKWSGGLCLFLPCPIKVKGHQLFFRKKENLLTLNK
jgi:hypothetical protein